MISRTKTAPPTPRTQSTFESTQNSSNERITNQMQVRRILDTSSAPNTPTGSRTFAEGYKPEIPTFPVRVSSFGSDALSCYTPDYPDRATISISSSFSSAATNSINPDCASNNHTRHVNLYDLIDEEFVVNCGTPSHKRSNSHGNINLHCTSRPGHRRRKSILDMIDRIVASDDDITSVMTTRSYPRGVYVVPPEDRETTVTGNKVAFVSAEAYNQW